VLKKHQKMKKKYYFGILIILSISIFLMLMEDQYYEIKTFNFNDKGDNISAVLNIPENIEATKPIPLIVFVHGDGETNADSFEYYSYMWNLFAKNGIATLSWDKKGVEGSSGNWLEQTMLNRAEEIVSAIDAIKLKNEYSFSSIGLIGFSQAGWVLPKVSLISEYPDYVISVSSAINWKRQSNYLTRKRLERLGKNDYEIDKAIEENEKSFILFEKTYEDYISHTEKNCKELEHNDCSVMSLDRFNFIRKNINSDNTKDIGNIQYPIFGLFGEDDVNVNSRESYNVFKKIFSKTNPLNYHLKMYPNATHSLLKSDKFNAPTPGIGSWLKMKYYGKNAFAKNVLDDMVEFILKQKQTKRYTTPTKSYK